MNRQIENIKKSRVYLLSLIKDLSTDQLNKTPPGFNNNIIWNLGHMVAAQQGICYVRSGLPMVVEDKYYEDYKPGTKPTFYIDPVEVEKIKSLMESTIDRLAADCSSGIFKSYNLFTTRYGAELASIDDAIAFLPYHEGLHAGPIMALKKLVG